MKPIRVVREKVIVPKPMARYDKKAGNVPGNLVNRRIKRKNPRGILLVNPFDDRTMRQLLAGGVIPGLRMVYQAKQVPTTGYRFILVVKPTSVELIRKTCPKAIIIGLNGDDRYGKEKDYQNAGVDGYWWCSAPKELLELIKRI